MTSNIIEMEDSSIERGVFLFAKRLDSELMVRCLQALLHTFPGMKFTSVKVDEKFCGFRVHFSSPDEETVLSKTHLSVDGQKIRIYPVTTYLIIHDIGFNGNVQIECEIRDAIKTRFGKFLYKINIPRSPSYQTEDLRNWRVRIDVPEIKELEVFDHGGLSEMVVELPNRNKKLKVTFYCRQCKKDGHLQQDCFQTTIKSEINETSDRMNFDASSSRRVQPEGRASEENVKLLNEAKNPFNISPRNFNIPLEPTETYAEKIGREEIMKTGIISEEIQKFKQTEPNKYIPAVRESTNNNLLTEKEIKREVTEDGNYTEANDKKFTPKDRQENLQNIGNHDNTVPKKENLTMFYDNHDSNSNSYFDGEIQVIEYLNNSNSSGVGPSQYGGKAEPKNSEEALNSPTHTQNMERSFSTFSSTPSTSKTNHLKPVGTRAAPVTAVESTSVLSERLQDCINNACNSCKILDRKTLDSFLVHVKKKSNPIRVASIFTQSASGLKEQLNQILRLYYNTPQTGTKEDIQFIKWLNGLVERFDGTVPRKRKRGQSGDDTSNKK